MLERVGHNNLPRLLDYYEGIGWISENVSNRLLELADEEKRYIGPSWTLSAEEHRKSMLFIEKISGKEIDDSLLISAPGRASLEPADAEKIRPRAGYLEAYSRRKGELEVTIQRREVTIKNLEQELEKKDAEMGKLKEKTQELEGQLAGCRMEVKKNLIYREILEENIRLKKGSLNKNVT